MSDSKIRISVVSYLNSTPFVKGLEGNTNNDLFEISQDIPSVCATKLLNDEIDIGLIPVAMIPQLKESYILTDYCIAADGKVASVLIIANEPLESLTTIILDSESRTSVLLAKILLKDYWKLIPEFKSEIGFDFSSLPPHTGAVIIGNRALQYKSNYKYCYDLAEVWKIYTGKPFVFACWVANKKIDKKIELILNNLFEEGLSQREVISEELKAQYPQVNISDYLYKNIQYKLTDDCRNGLKLFMELIKRL